jgi:hypothetical protein
MAAIEDGGRRPIATHQALEAGVRGAHLFVGRYELV